MARLKRFGVLRGVYDFVRNNKNIAFGCFEKSLNTVTRSVNYRQQNEETMPSKATTAAAAVTLSTAAQKGRGEGDNVYYKNKATKIEN